MKIGSLFSGYGGLETAARNVFGGEVAWVSDIDPGACKILAHHWPDVPNLGDITAVDWSTVEPVDIITGGSPCQDLSHAGKRGGMKTGTRSNLWVAMREAIAQLRPSWVVWENVRGAYSAEADSDVEPCPGCVGDGPSVHLRALGRVLGDLASIGYDAAWHGLTAASVGAPHGRYRVFLLAWPAPDTDDAANDRERACAESRSGSEGPPTHTDRVGHERAGDAWGRRGGPARGGNDAAHADGAGLAQREGIPGDARPERAAAERGRGTAANPESNARRVGNRDDGATAHPTRDGRHEGRAEPAGIVRGPDAAQRGHAPADAVSAWGQFAPAIARWERLTRPAPAPTELSAKGNQRLSPRFVEWMMGLPDGHVTRVPGIADGKHPSGGEHNRPYLTRNEQLKALGNGVVIQQCEAAIRHLLEATHA